MAGLSLRLALRPTLIEGTGQHEGIHTHGTLLLPVTTNDKPVSFTEKVLIIHELHPPIYNLAVEGGILPSWITGFTLQTLPPEIPAVPGPSAGPFIPGAPWVIPHGLPLPAAPLEPTMATTLMGVHVPGGFSHFSQPGAVHSFMISGVVPAGLTPDLYRYDIYLTGTLSPTGFPRQRIAKFSIGINIHRSTYT